MIDLIQKNPAVAAAVTFGNILIAEVSSIFKWDIVFGLRVPPIVMDLVQLMAWGTAIAVSVLTMYIWFRDKKWRKK
jgi:hypothetical protein